MEKLDAGLFFSLEYKRYHIKFALRLGVSFYSWRYIHFPTQEGEVVENDAIITHQRTINAVYKLFDVAMGNNETRVKSNATISINKKRKTQTYNLCYSS